MSKSKSYKSTFKQFENMAKVYIKGGSAVLEESFEGGDWSLFVVNRRVLAEAKLSKEDHQKLAGFDHGIAEVMTHDLLKEMAQLDNIILTWWDSDGSVEQEMEIDYLLIKLDYYCDLSRSYTFDSSWFQPKNALEGRDAIQDKLEDETNLFNINQLDRIKRADHHVLDKLDRSAEWVRHLTTKPDRPCSHWWWYLDHIKKGEIEPPNLELIFDHYLKKTRGAVKK